MSLFSPFPHVILSLLSHYTHTCVHTVTKPQHLNTYICCLSKPKRKVDSSLYLAWFAKSLVGQGSLQPPLPPILSSRQWLLPLFRRASLSSWLCQLPPNSFWLLLVTNNLVLLPMLSLSSNYLVSVLLPSNKFPPQNNCPPTPPISYLDCDPLQGTRDLSLLTLIFLLLMLKSPLELAFYRHQQSPSVFTEPDISWGQGVCNYRLSWLWDQRAAEGWGGLAWRASLMVTESLLWMLCWDAHEVLWQKGFPSFILF